MSCAHDINPRFTENGFNRAVNPPGKVRDILPGVCPCCSTIEASQSARSEPAATVCTSEGGSKQLLVGDGKIEHGDMMPWALSFERLNEPSKNLQDCTSCFLTHDKQRNCKINSDGVVHLVMAPRALGQPCLHTLNVLQLALSSPQYCMNPSEAQGPIRALWPYTNPEPTA